MKLNESLAIATLGIATLALFPSCQDEDFGYTAQQIKTSKFAQNFENQYGPIDPNQSWDLTNYMTRTAKYDDEALVDYLLQNGGQTRANGYYNPVPETLPESLKGIFLDDEGYYHVQENTIKWMRNYLKEGVNNTALGSAFSLRAPNNQIAIIPIYQGFANMDWSLYIRHNGSDTKLWEESKDILVSNDGGTTWDSKGTEYGTSQTVYDKEIKAKPIIVDLGKSSVKEFNLYLKVDKGLFKYDDNGNLVGKDSYAFDGAIQLSSMGMMLALPCPLPDNLGTTNGEQNLAMIVGCEDSDLAGSDWDMNDVCFLIVGLPALPNRIDITRKRYMCEDLGNTYDFDFNDIVVDVMEVVTSEYNAESNLFKPAGQSTQIATMKHVCGTLPFQVKVGNTWFNQVTDPTDEDKTKAELAAGVNESDIVNLPTTRAVNWNPEFSRTVTGWDHKTNNIEILVSTDANKNIDVLTDAFGDKDGAIEIDRDNHIYHITFADRGEAPLIIATDPTLMWMNEHQNIPESWWKEGTFKPTGSADNDAPADGGHTTDAWKEIPETLVKLDDAGNAVIWEAPEGFQGWGEWGGDDILTNFLDAVFEGYTTLEIEFASDNSAHQFRFIKVRDDWETYETVQITDGKFVHPFTGDITSPDEYYLGFAIMMDNSGGTLKPTRMIMKKPQTYTLTINQVEHGTVSVDVTGNSDGKYPEGTVVTVTATPESDWYFDQWNDGNKSNPRTITISGNLELTPTYTNQDVFAEGNVSLHREHTFGNDWTSFDISKDDLNLHQGDEIVFRVSSYSSDAKIEFMDLSWNAKRQVSPNNLNGSFVVEITEQMYNDYKDGLKIQGHNIVVESITKRCEHTTEPETDPKGDAIIGTTIAKGTTDLYDGDAVTIDEWDKNVTIAASKFNNAKVGDVIIVHTSGLYENSQAGLRENTNNWPAIAEGKEYFDITGDYELTIDQTILNKIQSSGLIITGKYYTIEDVTLRTTSEENPETEEPESGTEKELSATINTDGGGGNLTLSCLDELKDNDKIVFYLKKADNSNVQAGWGIGGIRKIDTWDGDFAESWSYQSGTEWTYEYTVSRIKEIAGTYVSQYNNTGITFQTYNGCSVTKVTVKPVTE